MDYLNSLLKNQLSDSSAPKNQRQKKISKDLVTSEDQSKALEELRLPVRSPDGSASHKNSQISSAELFRQNDMVHKKVIEEKPESAEATDATFRVVNARNRNSMTLPKETETTEEMSHNKYNDIVKRSMSVEDIGVHKRTFSRGQIVHKGSPYASTGTL